MKFCLKKQFKKIVLFALVGATGAGCVTVRNGDTYEVETKLSNKRTKVPTEARWTFKAGMVGTNRDAALQGSTKITGHCVHKDWSVFEIETVQKQTVVNAWQGYLGGLVAGIGGSAGGAPAVAIPVGLGLIIYTVVQSIRAVDDVVDTREEKRLQRTSSLFKCKDLGSTKAKLHVSLGSLKKSYRVGTNVGFKLPMKKMWSCEKLLESEMSPNTEMQVRVEAPQVKNLSAAEAKKVTAKPYISACYEHLHQVATQKGDRASLKKLTDLLSRTGGNQQLLGKAKSTYDVQLYKKAINSKEVEDQLDYLANCQICDPSKKKRVEQRRDKFKARDRDQAYRTAIRKKGLSADDKSAIGFAFLETCRGLPCKKTSKAANKLFQAHRKDKGNLKRLLNLCVQAFDADFNWCSSKLKNKTDKLIKKIERQEELREKAAEKKKFASFRRLPKCEQRTRKSPDASPTKYWRYRNKKISRFLKQQLGSLPVRWKTAIKRYGASKRWEPYSAKHRYNPRKLKIFRDGSGEANKFEYLRKGVSDISTEDEKWVNEFRVSLNITSKYLDYEEGDRLLKGVIKKLGEPTSVSRRDTRNKELYYINYDVLHANKCASLTVWVDQDDASRARTYVIISLSD